MAETPTPIAEIDHGPSKFEEFLDNHQKKLIIAAILIALGVIGYVIWSGLEEAKQHEAGSNLIKADEIADYQDVIKNHPGSTAAASAMPLLADMQWQDSQPDSIKTLEDFLSQHPEHPAAHSASVSLGLKLLDQGKTDEAKEMLSEIAESHPDSYVAPLACIALGDIAKSNKEIAEAKGWYEKAKGDGERTNAYLDIANSRLTIVNAVPPVKIKPAPPKPPVPPAPPATTGETPAVPVPPVPPAPPAEQTPAPDDASKTDTNTKPDTLPAPKLTIPDEPAEGTPDDNKTEPKPAPPAKPGDKSEPTL